jgi:hypothetical protein
MDSLTLAVASWKSPRSPSSQRVSYVPAAGWQHPAGPVSLLALTAGEIRRLLTAFTHPQHPGKRYQRWSRWRQCHQARAEQAHDQRSRTSQALPVRCCAAVRVPTAQLPPQSAMPNGSFSEFGAAYGP